LIKGLQKMDKGIEKLKEVNDEYTPIPFWFWNDYMSELEILRQMEEMKDKGVNGFVIHPRKGLPKEIEYLSDEYFRFVKFAVKKAKDMEMKVVLYDEAMYPSGSCRGMVVKANESYASQGLEMTDVSPTTSGIEPLAEVNCPEGKKYFYLVPSFGTIRGVHENEDDGEKDAPRSTDLLNPEAVKEFIKLTHEKYYEELKEYFGNTIVAFFTDEPCILGRNPKQGLIPWSDGIYEEFLSSGGTKQDLIYLFEKDEEIALDKDLAYAEKVRNAKRIYGEVIYNRMSKAYYSQLFNWCTNHNIALTGHPEKSTDIGYLQNFTWPCQDIVWRYIEPEDEHYITGEHSTMGKCSSDSARHRGKKRNGNECFGCCGQRQDPYLFTEDDMRWYLNWLFVRGVNLVYPHAFYYSIRDGRGDERPPEVGLGNPFWPDYKRMSNYIKRMCALNTDAVNQTEIAVLCKPEELSWKIAKPLFENQIEFNYLEEELLNSACKINSSKIEITDYKYSLLIYDEEFENYMLPETKEILTDFVASGGKVVRFSDEETLVSFIEKLSLRKIRVNTPCKDLRISYEIKGKDEYLIVTNEGMEEISTHIGVAGKTVKEVWDPYRDEIINHSIETDGSGIIHLNKYESRIIFLT